MQEISKKIQCQFVTYNDGQTIVDCMRSVLASDFGNLEVSFLLIDNCSTDGSIEEVKKIFTNKVKVVSLEENIGFAGGHNWGVRYALSANIDYIAVLNPDLLLEVDCLRKLASSLSAKNKVGIATPKLYRTTRDFKIDKSSIDACGMYFLPSMRHLDRTEDYSSEKEDPVNLFNFSQYAIGASGACFVISAECAKEVSFPKGLLSEDEDYLFDPDFFVYREDAELALRSQWMSWQTIYQPEAIGYHKRFVRPDNRKLVPENYNRMSVRNRFLFQGNDISLSLFLLTFPASIIRNVLVILGCFFQEKSSIPGLKEAISLRSRTWIKRKWIMRNRKVSSLIMYNWFKKEYSFPPALVKKEEMVMKVSKKITISAIVINYFQTEDLRECLESLSKIESDIFELSVTVVNNSEDDFQFKTLKEKYQNFSYVDDGKNYGFSGAINLVAKRVNSEILLVLNPDIIIESAAIDSCVNTFFCNSNLGAISPLLVDYVSQEVQLEYSLKRFPRIITLLSELPGIKKIFPNNPILKFQHYRDNLRVCDGILKKDGIFEVEQLAGACLFIRKEAFDRVLGFDESFYPAWCEDIDFGLKLYKNNYVSALNCNAKVVHKGGTSTSSIKKSAFLNIYYRNYLSLWKKYHFGISKLVGMFLLVLTFFIKRVFISDKTKEANFVKHVGLVYKDTIKIVKSCSN